MSPVGISYSSDAVFGRLSGVWSAGMPIWTHGSVPFTASLRDYDRGAIPLSN